MEATLACYPVDGGTVHVFIQQSRTCECGRQTKAADPEAALVLMRAAAQKAADILHGSFDGTKVEVNRAARDARHVLEDALKDTV